MPERNVWLSFMGSTEPIGGSAARGPSDPPTQRSRCLVRVNRDMLQTSLMRRSRVMGRIGVMLTATMATGLLLNGAVVLCAEQLSERQPHKWEVVSNQSLYDFLANGFELKSVAYDTSVLGPQSDSPDV